MLVLVLVAMKISFEPEMTYAMLVPTVPFPRGTELAEKAYVAAPFPVMAFDPNPFGPD